MTGWMSSYHQKTQQSPNIIFGNTEIQTHPLWLEFEVKTRMSCGLLGFWFSLGFQCVYVGVLLFWFGFVLFD